MSETMPERLELAEYGRVATGRRHLHTLETVILTALMLLVAAVMFLPFLWMISSSFKPYREILSLKPTIIPSTFTLANYGTLLAQLPFLRYFLNSFGVASVITIAIVFTSSLVGYVFAKFQFAGKEFLFIIIVSSMMVPFAVVVLPLYLLVARLGLVNSYVGLILPSLISGFGIFLMRQFMEGIPGEMLDAARIDGASDMWIYWQVMIPLSLNALSALAVFTFLWAWNSLWWPVMVVTRPEMRPLPLGIASLAWEFGVRTDLVITGAAIAVVPVLILFALMTRTVVQGVALTGMK